jgi:hypothetical protein
MISTIRAGCATVFLAGLAWAACSAEKSANKDSAVDRTEERDAPLVSEASPETAQGSEPGVEPGPDAGAAVSPDQGPDAPHADAPDLRGAGGSDAGDKVPSTGGISGGGGGLDGGSGGTIDGGAADGGVSNLYALPADRVTSWNLAGLLTKGGVPSAAWPLCAGAALQPSGGADDSAQINAAIAKCAAGTVLLLGPGTFNMGQGKFILIDKGVVLRGSGAGVTILKNPLNLPATASNQQAADETPVVIIGPGRWVGADGDGRCNGLTAYQTKYMQLLSADAGKGATSVTVADGSIFKAGQFVLLDETSNASWQPDLVGRSTSVWATPDYAVQWQLHQPAVAGDDLTYQKVTPSAANNWAGLGSGSDAACWFSRQDRPQNEIKEIASVSGNTVGFTSRLHKSYRIVNHAELTTSTGDYLYVQGAGLESLSVVGGGDGGVIFTNAAYSWAKNIEVSGWYGDGVSLGGFRNELRDSYIHDAAWPEPGGAGYALGIDGSELLVENNVILKANKVMVARSSGAGSVVAYNYADDGYIATAETWIEIGLNASHMVGPHHVLFEGNQSFNMDSDDTHGNSTTMTYFRNWATTTRAKFQSSYTGNTIDDAKALDNGPKRAAGAMIYSYWMSYVGNILGQPGVTTTANGYVSESDGLLGGDAMWLLGWNDVEPYTADANVAKTAIRDGNFDSCLGKQTWLSNSAAQLPDSLYLSAKPAFFGANPWPWVDPATGTIGTLPAKARFDSGTPNLVQ